MLRPTRRPARGILSDHCSASAFRWLHRARSRLWTRALLLVKLQLHDAPVSAVATSITSRFDISRRMLRISQGHGLLREISLKWKALAKSSPSMFAVVQRKPMLLTTHHDEHPSYSLAMTLAGFKQLHDRVSTHLHGQPIADGDEVFRHFSALDSAIAESGEPLKTSLDAVVGIIVGSADKLGFDGFAVYVFGLCDAWCENPRMSEYVAFARGVVFDSISGADVNRPTAPQKPSSPQRNRDTPRRRGQGASHFRFADDITLPKELSTWQTIDLSGKRDALFTAAGLARPLPPSQSMPRKPAGGAARWSVSDAVADESEYTRGMLRHELLAPHSPEASAAGFRRQLPLETEVAALLSRGSSFGRLHGGHRVASAPPNASRPQSIASRGADDMNKALGGSRTDSASCPSKLTSAAASTPDQNAAGRTARVSVCCFLTPSAVRNLSIPSASTTRAQAEQRAVDAKARGNRGFSPAVPISLPPTMATRMFTHPDEVLVKPTRTWGSASVIRDRRVHR